MVEEFEKAAVRPEFIMPFPERELTNQQVLVEVKEIEGLRPVVPPFITLVSITSDVYDMGKIHQKMADRGWGHMYGTHHGTEYIRLSIHQSRDMEHAQGASSAP